MKRIQSDALHKKRFGQYFSGKQVADMLFSLLPKNQEWKTVVDPMVGIGDMLVSKEIPEKLPQPEKKSSVLFFSCSKEMINSIL